MKLIAYTLGLDPPAIRPAPLERAWMDATTDRFAYRCLPLNIANQVGWEVLSPVSFEATWDGGPHPHSVIIDLLDDGYPPPLGHFGHGVLTFHVNVLFRTEPATQLFVTGPLNAPKDGIGALSGIIETDWSHYTFTMNWLFTRALHPVRFMKGEPIATVFPLSLGGLETLHPEFRDIASEPKLKSAYEAWQLSRNAFNEALDDPDSHEAKQLKWQKGYFRGIGEEGVPTKIGEHRTKVAMKKWDAPKKPKPRR